MGERQSHARSSSSTAVDALDRARSPTRPIPTPAPGRQQPQDGASQASGGTRLARPGRLPESGTAPVAVADAEPRRDDHGDLSQGITVRPATARPGTSTVPRAQRMQTASPDHSSFSDPRGPRKAAAPRTPRRPRAERRQQPGAPRRYRPPPSLRPQQEREPANKRQPRAHEQLHFHRVPVDQARGHDDDDASEVAPGPRTAACQGGRPPQRPPPLLTDQRFMASGLIRSAWSALTMPARRPATGSTANKSSRADRFILMLSSMCGATGPPGTGQGPQTFRSTTCRTSTVGTTSQVRAAVNNAQRLQAVHARGELLAVVLPAEPDQRTRPTVTMVQYQRSP